MFSGMEPILRHGARNHSNYYFLVSGPGMATRNFFAFMLNPKSRCRDPDQRRKGDFAIMDSTVISGERACRAPEVFVAPLGEWRRRVAAPPVHRAGIPERRGSGSEREGC